MANEDVQHHIFRGGRWLEVEPLPFYDPILTPADHQFAAAVAGTCLARGCSRQQAEQVAEKKLYERIYAARSLGVPRKQHRAPENKKEEAGV